MDLNMSKEVEEEVSRKRKGGFDRIIDGLNFSSKNKPQPHINPTVLRRDKFISQLENQLQLLNKPNSIYLKKLKRIRDKESGLMKEVEVDKRVGRWFWEEGNKFYLQLKYGNNILYLKKGKGCIVCDTKEELRDTLLKLRESCEIGELDNLLKDVGYNISNRFRK